MTEKKYKLIIFDVDGIFYPEKNRWLEGHRVLGTLKEGTEATEKYLNTDYKKLVEIVIEGLWKGRDATPFLEMIKEVKMHEGIDELFSFLDKYDLKRAVISGSIKQLFDRISSKYHFDYVYINEAVIENGVFSGEFKWPVGAAQEEKVVVFQELINKLGIKTEEAIYIGDSKRDIPIFKEVGLPIAFNCCHDELRNYAKEIVDSNNLKDLVPVFEKYLS